MINKSIPALLFQASLNDRSMGLVTEVSEGRVWGRSLVVGFQYFQSIPSKYGSSVIWSKLIELLLCLLPAFSSYVPWDEGDGDQKEWFPFPHHKVKWRSCCDDVWGQEGRVPYSAWRFFLGWSWLFTWDFQVPVGQQEGRWWAGVWLTRVFVQGSNTASAVGWRSW